MKRIPIVLMLMCAFGLAPAQGSAQVCQSDGNCGAGYFCKKEIGACQQPGVCTPKAAGVVCIQLYDPVCGCNNVTYSNSCFALLANANIAYPGACGSCTDVDRDYAYSNCLPLDCDDYRASVNPWAPEVCDGLDNNCDGRVDESFDADADGFSVCGGDCNDSNASINPGMMEICDGLDNNCDQAVDEGFDLDGDGATSCAGDCNDSDALVYPGAPEIVRDGIDQDCNGYDLTIAVTRAQYARKSQALTVTATSSLNAAAALEVVDFGPMLWNAKKKTWAFSAQRLADPPAEVVVRGPEGAVRMAVATK